MTPFPVHAAERLRSGQSASSAPVSSAAQTTLAIANDPDADRMAVSEIALSGVAGGDGGDAAWRNLTGNEIGVLLADWLWTQKYKVRPVSLR